MTQTQLLYALGGKVGSKLSGKDEDGTDVILITKIGAERIWAKCVEKNGKPWDGHEANWGLHLREWKVIE